MWFWCRWLLSAIGIEVLFLPSVPYKRRMGINCIILSLTLWWCTSRKFPVAAASMEMAGASAFAVAVSVPTPTSCHHHHPPRPAAGIIRQELEYLQLPNTTNETPRHCPCHFRVINKNHGVPLGVWNYRLVRKLE